MSLRGRIQRLEDSVITVPEPPPEPPETEEARLAREEFEGALAALRERCGGKDELAEGVAHDPEAWRLAKRARELFRAWLRVTRRGSHEQP